MKRSSNCLLILLGIILLFGCDIFENENEDWKNDVTISIVNLTVCPLDIYIDGRDKDRLESGEDLSDDNYGEGIHLLEAYPWNDVRESCEMVYTGKMKNGEIFNWEILPENECGECDPTPTPVPTTTPNVTPSPTAIS